MGRNIKALPSSNCAEIRICRELLLSTALEGQSPTEPTGIQAEPEKYGYCIAEGSLNAVWRTVMLGNFSYKLQQLEETERRAFIP